MLCEVLLLHAKGEGIFQCLGASSASIQFLEKNMRGFTPDGAAVCIGVALLKIVAVKVYKKHPTLSGWIVFSTEKHQQ